VSLKEKEKDFKKISYVVLGFVMILVMGLIDFNVDPGLSFLVVYLSPIFIISWFGGFYVGVLGSIASAMIWFFDDKAASAFYTHPLIPYWNLTIKFIFFIIFVYIITRLKKALDRESQFARTDSLTGLANRRYFFDYTEIELNKARRNKKPFSVAYFDVDDFKRINDSLGHHIGDKLLALTGKALKETIRNTDFATRMGGDEFVVFLPETDENYALNVIKRINSKLITSGREHKISVSFSFGLVTFMAVPSNMDEVIKACDIVMYSAKKEGKNLIKHTIWKW